MFELNPGEVGVAIVFLGILAVEAYLYFVVIKRS